MLKKIISILIISLTLYSCSTKLETSLGNLDSNDTNLKIQTLEDLRDEKITEYKPVIIKALKDKDAEIVWRALDLCGYSYDMQFIDILLPFLSDENPLISYTAKGSLIRLGSETEGYLLENFSKYNERTKIMVLKCLKITGTDKTISTKFDSENDNVRRHLRNALAIILERETRKDLTKFVSEIVKNEARSISPDKN